jgi:hypothetical protein
MESLLASTAADFVRFAERATSPDDAPRLANR